MCVRFELYNTPKIIKMLKGVNYTLDKPKEIRPGDMAPIIAMDKNLKPKVFVMKWGYGLNGKLIYNSRSEDITNRKMFKQDFQTHRLAVPATAYYEWDKEKTKYKLQANSDIIYFAGIYHLENNNFVFSILTQDASEEIKNIHDRMPVILSEKQVKKYIYPRTNINELPINNSQIKMTIQTNENKLF